MGAWLWEPALEPSIACTSPSFNKNTYLTCENFTLDKYAVSLKELLRRWGGRFTGVLPALNQLPVKLVKSECTLGWITSWPSSPSFHPFGFSPSKSLHLPFTFTPDLYSALLKVYAVLHKERDNTEQEDISAVPTRKAKNSELFWKPRDGCELRRGLLNVKLVSKER